MKPYEQLKAEILSDFEQDGENLRVSLDRCDPEIVHRVSELRELFAGFFVSLPKPPKAFKRLSAFGIYNIECVHLLRRATIETLACYYGVGHSLLRSALESLVRGAFFECIARAQFRETAERVRSGRGLKIEGGKKTILDWLADVAKHTPEAEQEFESISASVFDRSGQLFSDPLLKRALPDLKTIVEQISDWKMLKPMEEPVASLHGFLYGELSKEVHLIPDKTLLGRLVDQEDYGAFATRPSPYRSKTGPSSIT